MVGKIPKKYKPIPTKITNLGYSTRIAGNFDCYVNVVVGCGAHCPITIVNHIPNIIDTLPYMAPSFLVPNGLVAGIAIGYLS